MDERHLPGRSLPPRPAPPAAPDPPRPAPPRSAPVEAAPPAGAADSPPPPVVGPPEPASSEAPPPAVAAPAAPGPYRSRAQEATIALLRAADVVRGRLADAAEAGGITLQQYNVLRVLRGARGQPLQAREIGDRLIERTPGTTRLLDRLEEANLIRRERSRDDRRVVLSWLTDRGLEVLETIDPHLDAADAASMDALDETERTALIQLLTRLRRPASARPESGHS